LVAVVGRRRLGEVEDKGWLTEQRQGLGIKAVSMEHGGGWWTEAWRDRSQKIKGREWGLVAVVGRQSKYKGLVLKQ